MPITTVKNEVEQMQKEWQLCLDLEKGVSAMRNSIYLKQFKGESSDGYKLRMSETYLNNKFIEKISVSCGLILNKKIKYDYNVPEYIINDTDRNGSTIDTFSLSLLKSAEISGHSFIYVDSPKTEQNISVEYADKNNIHPYFAKIDAKDVINYEFDDNNKLSFIVTKTKVTKKVDDFETESKNAFCLRAMEDDRMNVYYYVQNSKGEYYIDDDRTILTDLELIPIVELNLNKKAKFLSAPPFTNIANLTLSCFQLESQKRRALKMVCDPDKAIFDTTLAANLASGNVGDGNSLTFGADIVQVFDTDARYEYVEPTGRGVELVTKEIADIEKKIDGLGADLVKKQTATEAEITNTKATAADILFSTELESALNEAFELLKIYDTSISSDFVNPFSLSRDFARSELSSNEITALNGMTLSGNLSRKTLLMAVGSGTMPNITTIEEAKTEIEAITQESVM